MGGKPSKGTKRDKRLKDNTRRRRTLRGLITRRKG